MEELQDRLGYHFNSTPLLEEALHPAGTRPLQGNKRLALVGDSVLSTSLLDEWYDTEDGDHILRKNACNKHLSCKGEACELDDFITGQPAQKGEITNGTRATTVEAILGAVWIDSGKNIHAVDRVKANLGIGV
ncbi:hypothetical protein PENARI_c108G02119 [Penicillium arizonense]|uniref:RNase III domain-containing protein n=1 Tax=Penicillium arizonense TaxID=1835702 RepID=A0A1F5L1F8_PENAI|nr:hypothetical protein PENARI_c124G09432 [Penicillium arizonense]XP_022482215.1 hypothetical protein PENARI_c122G07213 [Penicillium arizonense]XP_022482266.1 hypothetical protein PENARI_c108G02119 [Penicillium arizonense]OGE46740.1 hypothetical protein PENARI_c124G09432 [Penicillium arizonense]OGE46747.1 hypothetical protein PENARI_c122G07213 [Penicillium arizonense]OGE46799.1 hypothetical protein PENARI_c108G02119 [Penicillium arizonense]